MYLLPDFYIKTKLTKFCLGFIWGPKWEKVGRWQLCCDIVDGEAKMIDINQHMLALQFKAV